MDVELSDLWAGHPMGASVLALRSAKKLLKKSRSEQWMHPEGGEVVPSPAEKGHLLGKDAGLSALRPETCTKRGKEIGMFGRRLRREGRKEKCRYWEVREEYLISRHKTSGFGA